MGFRFSWYFTLCVLSCSHCYHISLHDTAPHGSWELVGSCPSVAIPHGHLKKKGWHNFTSCIAPGRYELLMHDEWGDGWNGGSVSIKVSE